MFKEIYNRSRYYQANIECLNDDMYTLKRINMELVKGEKHQLMVGFKKKLGPADERWVN